MAFDPTVRLVPEAPALPLLSPLVHPASGLEARTETDGWPVWSVCTSPEVREAEACLPRPLPQEDQGGWGPSTRKPEQGAALFCDTL